MSRAGGTEIVQQCKTTLRRPISIFKTYFGNWKKKTSLPILWGGWELHKGYHLEFCQFIINTEMVKPGFKWELSHLPRWIQSHRSHQNLTRVWNSVWFPDSTGGVAGQRLSEHPDVRKLGFTGSTLVGKQIMKRYSFEYVNLLQTLLNQVFGVAFASLTRGLWREKNHTRFRRETYLSLQGIERFEYNKILSKV